MQDNKETEEIKQLKREIAKLRLEGNLRKSLSNQLTIQKKIADDAKAEALTKSEEVAKISNQLAKTMSRIVSHFCKKRIQNLSNSVKI